MSRLEPLFDVDELVVVLEFCLFLWHFIQLFVEMHYEPLQQEVLLLKVPVFGHRVGLVGKNALLLESGVLNKVYVPELRHAYCLA